MLVIASVLIGCSSNYKKYKSFDEYPVYNGNDLELTYSATGSKFRVWAPTADEIETAVVRQWHRRSGLYDEKYAPLEKRSWVVAVSGDLKGKFYTFQIKTGEKWLNETHRDVGEGSWC